MDDFISNVIFHNTFTTVRWGRGKIHALGRVEGWAEWTACGKRVPDNGVTYSHHEIDPWNVPDTFCPKCGFDY
jgi:hypothetical protein